MRRQTHLGRLQSKVPCAPPGYRWRIGMEWGEVRLQLQKRTWLGWGGVDDWRVSHFMGGFHGLGFDEAVIEAAHRLINDFQVKRRSLRGFEQLRKEAQG